MKFMYVVKVKDSYFALPPEKVKEIGDALAQHHEKLTKEGKLKGIYMFGNMKGAMAIYDLDSAEDLISLAASPMFPFVDAEITPLVDMEVARKAQTKK
jgi:muconolactone delta-isomerase